MRRCRSYRYLLKPTVRQQAALVRLLDLQRELYNAALEERRGAWRWNHRPVSFFDQCRTLTGLREVRPEVVTCGVTVCRGTLRRLDWAFAGFYRRCQAGQRPGYPRFRPPCRWDSVQWEDRSGWRLECQTGHLRLTGIGALEGPRAPTPRGNTEGYHTAAGGAALVGGRPLRRRPRPAAIARRAARSASTWASPCLWQPAMEPSSSTTRPPSEAPAASRRRSETWRLRNLARKIVAAPRSESPPHTAMSAIVARTEPTRSPAA